MRALLSIVVIGVAARASGQALTWDPGVTSSGTTGGSGNWAASNAWWNGTSDTTWSDGNDAYFAGTAGIATLPSTPTPTAKNLYFNTNGYMLGGGAITLSGGTITVQPGAIATVAASKLNFLNNYSVQGGGTLALTGTSATPIGATNNTSMNIATGTTLVLADSGGSFGKNPGLVEWPLGAGGTINGNLVISQPYQEIEFMPYAGTSNQPTAGTQYTFSGSGQILCGNPACSLATHKNQTNGTGWISNVNVPIVLNSSNLPFTPFDVTKPIFATSPVFGTAIGATKWATMTSTPRLVEMRTRC